MRPTKRPKIKSKKARQTVETASARLSPKFIESITKLINAGVPYVSACKTLGVSSWEAREWRTLGAQYYKHQSMNGGELPESKDSKTTALLSLLASAIERAESTVVMKLSKTGLGLALSGMDGAMTRWMLAKMDPETFGKQEGTTPANAPNPDSTANQVIIYAPPNSRGPGREVPT